MQKISVKFVMRTLKKDTQTAAIYIRISTFGRQKMLSCGINTAIRSFSEKKQEVLKTDKDYAFKNEVLKNKLADVQNIILKYQRAGLILSFDKLDDELFYAGRKNSGNFYDFVIREIDRQRFCPETRKTYLTQITKLQKFKKSLYFADITENFLQKYFRYMTETLDNKESTAYKSLSMLKTFVRWAQERKLIVGEPFKHLRIKKIGGNRQYLTKDELKMLENLYKSGSLTDERKEILGYFLFSCYTGLRFQDIKNLRKENFYFEVIAGHRRLFVKLIQHKTRQEVTIPILPKAEDIINTYHCDKHVFNVRSNQITNKRLKTIIEQAGIDKDISFHCARHTFATLALNEGVSFDVVSKMLGHTDLKTTQIYARITNENKFFQILKMENL